MEQIHQSADSKPGDRLPLASRLGEMTESVFKVALALSLIASLSCATGARNRSRTNLKLQSVQGLPEPLVLPSAAAPDESAPPPKSDAKIRTRAEIIKLLVENKSLTPSGAVDLDRQLSLIAKYLSSPQLTYPTSDFKSPEEETLLSEVISLTAQVKKIRGYAPRETQLIAVLLFLKGENRLLQAGTGQGKSLIVAMAAILQQKLKLPLRKGYSRPMAVHIVTPTDNLARAGFKENQALFESLQVRARHISSPGKASDIVYGTPFDFEGDSLSESCDPTLPRLLLDPAVRRTVILDESDSHLIDGATGRVLRVDRDPQGPVVKGVLKEIARRIGEYYGDSSAERSTPDVGGPLKSRPKTRPPAELKALQSVAALKLYSEMILWVKKNYPDFEDRFKHEGFIWISNGMEVFDPSEFNPWKNGVRFVLKNSIFSEMNEFFMEQVKVQKSQLFFLRLKEVYAVLNHLLEFYKKGSSDLETEKKETQQLSQKLAEVLKVLHKDSLPIELRSHYENLVKLNERLTEISQPGWSQGVRRFLLFGDVKYLSVETGQIIDNMVFGGGIQEFLELKHTKIILHEPTISIRSYSLFKYVRGADVVWGLSGTVGVSEAQLMKFQKHVWESKNTTILPDFAVPRLKNVAKPVHTRDLKSWIQVVTETTKERLAEQPVLIITENPYRAWNLKEQLAGQGVHALLYAETSDEHLLDEKLGPGQAVVATNLGGRGSDYKYDAGKAPKGLHVILGFDSDEERILQQARGRSGRAGSPGSWQMISFGPRLKQKPNMLSVEKGLEEVLSEDMLMEVYLALANMTYKLENRSKEEKLKTLVMKWLSKVGVRSELRKQVLQPKAKVGALVSGILIQWKKYLQEDVTDSARSEFLELMSSRENGAVAQLTHDFEQSRRELERLRKPH